MSNVNNTLDSGLLHPGNAQALGILELFVEVAVICTTIGLLIISLLFYVLSEYSYMAKLAPFPDEPYVNPEQELPYSQYPRYFSKNVEASLEIVFLFVPSCIIICMILPTLGFLYNTNLLENTELNALFTIDVVGHQWYWSYNYELGSIQVSYDSILDLEAFGNLLMEVDLRMVLPLNEYICLNVISDDVIHSWAVPSLGIKIDAIPGRTTTAILSAFVTGTFYGQCSELCGVYHGFMPIAVEVVPLHTFVRWLCEMEMDFMW